MDYTRIEPCNNCPYRCDAPLQHWSIEEFKDLISNDKTVLGANYGCHKKDGHVCVGFLMNQDNRNLPSIILRMSLSKNGITTDYLDKLNCKSKMYASIEEMATANYSKL